VRRHGEKQTNRLPCQQTPCRQRDIAHGGDVNTVTELF
jgi:hypothetical protein